MKHWKTMSIALALSAASAAPAWAADCKVEIEGNDAMQFNKASISVPASCKEFTVTLKNAGKLPKAAMGHNWVLTKTADMQAVATDGLSAGVDKDYLKAGDARVLAHTKMLGPDESDSVTFATDILKAGESYSYLCTFPGHAALMKGTITLER